MQRMQEKNMGCLIGIFGFVSVIQAQNSQYLYNANIDHIDPKNRQSIVKV